MQTTRASVYQKGRRLLTTKGMLPSYMRWTYQRLVSTPTVDFAGSKIAFFDSFSEYWGTQKGLPTAGELRFIERVLDNSSVSVDIGANIGVYSILLGSTARSGRVYAFEPVNQTFEKLQANVRANQLENVHCIEMAVSDIDGEISFLVDLQSPATNRIGASRPRPRETLQQVRTTSLDTFCANYDLVCLNFVKIDVEGFEAAVLRGASDMLRKKRIKTMLIEICPENLRQTDSNVSEIAEQIRPFGYDFYDLSDSGTPGDRLTEAVLETYTLHNVLVLPYTSE